MWGRGDRRIVHSRVVFALITIMLCLAAFSIGGHASEYDEVDPTGGEAVIWYRVSRPDQVAVMERLTSEFNSSNAFHVKVTAVSAGGYDTIYSRAIAARGTDQLPDMLIAFQGQLAAYQVTPGLELLDLSSLLQSKRWGSPQLVADVPSSALAANVFPEFGGAQLGFPAQLSMEVMFVNRDWLKELGEQEVPQQPSDFERVACLAAARNFTRTASRERRSVGMTFTLDASFLASVILAYGGEVMDVKSHRYLFDSAPAIFAAQLLARMARNGCLAPATQAFGEQADFTQGVSLMVAGSSNSLPFYRDTISKGVGFEWSLAALPYTTQEPRPTLFGPSFGIFRKEDKRRQIAAWLWLQYFMLPESQAEFVRVTGYVPVRSGASRYLYDYAVSTPQFQSVLWLLEKAVNEAPPVGSYEDVRRSMAATLAQLVNGKTTEVEAEQLMRDLATGANRLQQRLERR